MAAPPQVPTVPNTPLLNRNHDEYTYGNARLPSGPCNYINVNSGANAPKCGCRRFAEKSVELYGDGAQTRPGLCFCDHHSCFHNHDPVDGPLVLAQNSATGGMSLTPKPSMHRQPLLQRDHDMEDAQPEVGRLMKSESLPDTLPWGRYIKSGSSLGSLPAIPSQCLLPSEDGSRASSSQTGNMRPFGGLGLNTLSHAPKASSSGLKGPFLHENERRMQVYEDSHGNTYMQSLAEVATVSRRSSQDLDAGLAFGKNVAKVQNNLQRISEERSQSTRPDGRSRTGSNAGVSTALVQTQEHTENLLPRIRSIISHVADYPMKIQNHEQRLDQLENASFSHAVIDELQENTGYLETRIEVLETRADELEKARLVQSDTGSFGGRQHLDGSFDSQLSNASSALIAAAMSRVDYARLETLEAQISELQATAPPSHARPWEVEVVFLPFGPRLSGIWSSQHSITQPSRVNSTVDEGMQTQYNSMALAQANLATHDEGVSWEMSMKDLGNQDDTWLMPRACTLDGRIGERLKSRGLIKSIQIKGPDARDVQAALISAFGDLPKMLTEDPYSNHSRTHQTIPDPLSTYLGLRALWVPLRKLHKDSNLRFLNTSEMVTPALWTVHFLSSSIAMRAAGTRRLYVTQPDSYIQHLRDESAEWTWQKLRQLPRVYSDTQPINHTPEADAHEPCWEFDERLDQPLSINLSFASHHSSLSIRPISYEQEVELMSPSDHLSSEVASPIASTTPTSIPPPPGRPISPLKERQTFRPLHKRTTSMPSFIPLKSSPSMTKRRIASFDLESQSSPTRAIQTMLKRRRISRSPSRPRDTPRWSVGPPSPYTNLDDNLERNKRGMTPFAYATPHSNAPYIEASRHMRDGDDEAGSATDEFKPDEEYDQNALSGYETDEMASNVGRQLDEDVWEGVQEDDSRYSLTARANGLRQDDDVASETSSRPSEYPSHHVNGFYSDTKSGFRIHIDEGAEETY